MFTLIPPSTNLSFFYFKLFFLETVFLDLTPDISMPLELSYFENLLHFPWTHNYEQKIGMNWFY